MPFRPVRLMTIVCVAVAALACTAVAAQAAPQSQAVIVVLRDGGQGASAAAARRHGASPQFVFGHALSGYAAHLPSAAIDRARRDPAVLYVAADRRMSIAGKPTSQPAQIVPTGILRIGNSAARFDGVGDVNDVDVAVVDTGIDTKHPDLAVVGGRNCSSGSSYNDGNGHGTHVAGTIAARDNAIGVAGVAPGARLHAVRVLNNAGSGSTSSVICGLDWVTANAATIEVANLSLGGPGSDDGDCGNSNNDPLHRAICRTVAAGVTVVVAAGNDASDASGTTPAAYDEAITVSAFADFDGAAGGLAAATCRADEDDSFASFSNFGADVDLAAPGVCIRSTWKGSSYNTISGTSMAAPHTAGAAALYLIANPLATPAEVREALVTRVDTTPVSDDRDAVWEGLLALAGWL